MKPLFLGGHPALDFLNTWLTPLGEPVELLGDGRSFIEWLVAAGLLEAATGARLMRRRGSPGLDAVAAEARNFREWLRAWMARWREDRHGGDAPELRLLNGILERAPILRRLVATTEGHELVERCRIDAADQLLGLVALQVARLVAGEEPTRVKRCEGSDCSLWFLDRTKARRRMFCSATACGNRAKVAAFRERQRRH